MINIVLYKHSKDFYQLDYSQFNKTEKVVFITPSPFHADTLRSKLANQKHEIDFDVITMSKYLKDELVNLVDEQILEKFKGKAELILYLSTAWKAMSSELNVGLFKKAFNLLTDFRSFSLSDQVMDAALEDYDKELSKVVLGFHKIVEHESIIDEHYANFILSERLRKGDLPIDYDCEKAYVFWGFDFLSAVQVDLLKAIAIRGQVFVPVVKEVFEKAQSTDWVKWLIEDNTNYIYLEEVQFEFKAKIKEFPNNYLSRALAKELKENKSCDIYLATKTINITAAQEVNLTNHLFKVSTNFFTDAITNLFEKIKIYLEENNLEVPSGEILLWLEQLQNESLSSQDFRNLKVVLLFKKSLIEWCNLSDYNNKFTLFDLYIFKEVIMLDLPRVSLMPLGKEKEGKIAGIKELAAFNPAATNILCVTSNYGPIKGSGSNYTEKVEKYLTSIGPIRRADFEFEMLKHRIFELLEYENSTVLIENGLMEHDVGWSSILSEIKETAQSAKLSEVITVKKDFVTLQKINTKSFSATRLQNYIDCPRKYYLNYVAKYNPAIQIPGILDLLKIGELQHAVIEKYLGEFHDFNDDQFLVVIQSCLDDLIEKYSLKINAETKTSYIIETKSLCIPIIRSLIQINKILGLNLSFEHGIIMDGATKYTGSIDLFAHNDKFQFVLDFKRGSGSIPSQKSFVDFEKVQLWFYLQRLKELEVLQTNKELVFGYINLSKPEDSLIVCSSELTRSLLMSSELDHFKKVSILKTNIDELLIDYKKLELETIELIQNEKYFHPRPKTPKVCDFCAIKNICTRENLDE